MRYDKLIAQLIEEQHKHEHRIRKMLHEALTADRKIAAAIASDTRSTDPTPKTVKVAKTTKRRSLSKQARLLISRAQKARWAKIHAGKV